MIQLYQFDWSPFCLIQRRILDYARIRYETVHVSQADRSVVWRITRERYYQVPVLKHGRQVVFETGPNSQVIAKYLDAQFNLGLFPREWDGVQELIWRYTENDIEDLAFRLNDIHWREFVPKREQAGFIRHKERKFGRGCLDLWAEQKDALLRDFEQALRPMERMLASRPFLLCDRPLFVDFCLYGMIANFLFSGHYELPAAHPRLRDWHARIKSLRQPKSR
jgi:glutathione S-transferase